MIQDQDQSSFGLTPNVAAGLASLFHWVGGLVILLGKPTQQWVRFVAVQSIVLSIVVAAVYIALWIVLAFVSFIPGVGGILAFIVWLGMMLVGFAYFVAWLIQTVKAFQGQAQRFPVISEWTDRWVPASAAL